MLEIKILDAGIEGLGNAEAAAVEPFDDELAGVAVEIRDEWEDGADILLRWGAADGGRASGAQGIDALEWFAEPALVETAQRMKGDILRAGGAVQVGAMGKVGFDFPFAGKWVPTGVFEQPPAVAVDFTTVLRTGLMIPAFYGHPLLHPIQGDLEVGHGCLLCWLSNCWLPNHRSPN